MKFSLLLILTCIVSSSTGQNTFIGTIEHDGLVRDYVLHLPPTYEESEQNLALVFNFHGYTSNAEQQRLYSGMDNVADTANFIVCYPNGVDNAWNVGWDFGSTEDDVGFISALIDNLVENYKIDSDRIYSCGMSNGGFFSYKLACELNDKITAIASVTGSMVPGTELECTPNRAVPVMEIHGTADFIVPYGGSPGVALPIEDVVNFWVQNNQCESPGESFIFPDISISDQSTAFNIVYGQCAENTSVEFITILNGGHTWPGAGLSVGVTNLDINASEIIWAFFDKHRLPTVSADDVLLVNDVIIYPNPTGGRFFIRGVENNAIVEVFSISGEKIISLKGQSSNGFQIDAQTGTYLLRVIDNNTIISKILIIQN